MQVVIMLLVAVALMGAGAAGGWKVANDHRDALELAEAKGKADALEATAQEIAKVKVVQQNITKQAETIVREKTVYAECKNTPEMVQVLNAAAAGGSP